jgi:hypothetical protein
VTAVGIVARGRYQPQIRYRLPSAGLQGRFWRQGRWIVVGGGVSNCEEVRAFAGENEPQRAQRIAERGRQLQGQLRKSC